MKVLSETYKIIYCFTEDKTTLEGYETHHKGVSCKMERNSFKTLRLLKWISDLSKSCVTTCKIDSNTACEHTRLVKCFYDNI